ncbi:phosphotransferase [Streptomyces sp. DSM 44917]|uniref:Phosphotransferase n=1 Tax=Streptomyces boetiae TaxID=3075541 RepID=A0ABU2L706_9ACTN|nr:phosphotransferase [Streptomyces sp. DSM 44917]MDT0307102.1 phosphotransferase [Streptomyces sp. DSM 44917]
MARSLPPGQPEVLADRGEVTVVRVGEAVAKAHPAGTDLGTLAARLRAAASPALADVLLPPLRPARPDRLPDGRPVTRWPYGAPVDPAAVPWEAAGTLLARLHATDLAALGPRPPAGAPARAARALARLRRAPTDPAHAKAREAAEQILATTVAASATGQARAAAASGAPAAEPGSGERPDVLPEAAADAGSGDRAGDSAGPSPDVLPEAPGGALCHGDFHLGQLVRHPAPEGDWRLIDVDDLGVGDPAWDLARPAAWYAAGLLPGADWERLLGAYRAAGGGPAGDPWAWLDGPARALTAQYAALALVRSARDGRPPGEQDLALLESCLRIAALS